MIAIIIQLTMGFEKEVLLSKFENHKNASTNKVVLRQAIEGGERRGGHLGI